LRCLLDPPARHPSAPPPYRTGIHTVPESAVGDTHDVNWRVKRTEDCASGEVCGECGEVHEFDTVQEASEFFL